MRTRLLAFTGLGIVSVSVCLADHAGATAIGNALCSIVNQIPPISSGDSFKLTPHCKQDSTTDVYYDGSSNSDGLSQLVSQPFLMGTAEWCALADANGANAVATTPSAFGTFGITSRMNIFQRDPASGILQGQRVGTLSLFGASMDLEVQNFKWTNSTESRAAGTINAVDSGGTSFVEQVPAQTGYYTTAVSNGINWDVTASGSWAIPVPPLQMTVTGAMGERWNEASYNNDNISVLPSASSPFNYAAAAAQCAVCKAQTCTSFICLCPTCPNDVEEAGHDRVCPPGGTCNTAYFENQSDHMIPYDGQSGGAAGPFLFHDSVPNWFHYGFPGPGPSGSIAGPNEPVYAIGSSSSGTNAINNSSLYFQFEFDIGFSVASFTFTVGLAPVVAFRDGFALRQNYVPFAGGNGDVPGQRPVVATSIDAESTVTLDAPVKIDIPIFGEWDHTFHLFGATTGSKVNEPTRIMYANDQSTAFLDYQSRGVHAADPNQALQACLAPPATPPPPSVTPQSPGAFIDAVRKSAASMIRPCNVHICDGSFWYTDKYDPIKKVTTISKTTTPCSPQLGAGSDICSSTYQLCDGSGSDLQSHVLKDANGAPVSAVASDDVRSSKCQKFE